MKLPRGRNIHNRQDTTKDLSWWWNPVTTLHSKWWCDYGAVEQKTRSIFFQPAVLLVGRIFVGQAKPFISSQTNLDSDSNKKSEATAAKFYVDYGFNLCTCCGLRQESRKATKHYYVTAISSKLTASRANSNKYGKLKISQLFQPRQ